MSRSRVAIFLLMFAAILVPSIPADGSYKVICTGYSACSSAGYDNYGYQTHQGTMYWNMYAGTNCTNYVAYRLITTNGMSSTRPKPGVGNARDWGTAEASITNSTPAYGSVAWWGKNGGDHVAYVEKVVSSTEVYVSESNWAGAFDWRLITKSGGGWPDGFIHFKDLVLKNTAKPTITGTVKVGSTVTASTGTWSPSASTFTYQWYAAGTAISGATAKTFTPTAAQQDDALTVRVTAAKASYAAGSATSAASTVAPGALRSSVAPTISGTTKVDSTFTATPGTWNVAGTTYKYSWRVDGAVVQAGSTATFTPGPDALGKPVGVTVTASKTGYVATSKSATPTDELAPGAVKAGVAPTVSGTPKVGVRLTATPGTEVSTGTGKTVSGQTRTYQWSVGGVAVPGATASTYTPSAADVGHTVRVAVTSTLTGYDDLTASSALSAKVVSGTFTVASKPTISGDVKVGGLLTASPGTWSPKATSYTYQWLLDGKAVAGATASTYRPVTSQRGHTLSVKVTAHQDGYVDASATSASTSAVVDGYIRWTGEPTVTGSTLLGSTLKVAVPTTTPTTAKHTYQWLRSGKVISGATGATHTVVAADLGHKLSVRLTFTAAGYGTRSGTSVETPYAQSTARVSGTATAKGHTVTIKVRVAATDVTTPSGAITVTNPVTGKAVKVALSKGAATITLTGQVAGRHTYALHYSGSTTVHSLTVGRTVTVG